MIVVMITIKKRSYTDPLGMIPVECDADTPTAIEKALAAMQTANFGDWVYQILNRDPDQKLIVVENYPTGQIVSGKVVAM